MLVGVCEKAELFNAALNAFSPFCRENLIFARREAENITKAAFLEVRS